MAGFVQNTGRGGGKGVGGGGPGPIFREEWLFERLYREHRHRGDTWLKAGSWCRRKTEGKRVVNGIAAKNNLKKSCQQKQKKAMMERQEQVVSQATRRVLVCEEHKLIP